MENVQINVDVTVFVYLDLLNDFSHLRIGKHMNICEDAYISKNFIQYFFGNFVFE